MTRKGTEGRSPQKNIGASDSAIDKAIKKTKEAFSGGDNEKVDYDEVKHKSEAEARNDQSQDTPDSKSKEGS